MPHPAITTPEPSAHPIQCIRPNCFSTWGPHGKPPPSQGVSELEGGGVRVEGTVGPRPPAAYQGLAAPSWGAGTGASGLSLTTAVSYPPPPSPHQSWP